MIIAGIDYSITCPSVCIFDTSLGALSFNKCRFYVCQQSVTKKELERRKETDFNNIFFCDYPYKKNDDNIERFYLLADWCMSIIVNENVNIISMEAYALGAKGLVFNIAEATGILKSLFLYNNIQYKLYPPSLNKKVFSGKGNANKELMINTFNEKNNINISDLLGIKNNLTGSPISDIVDSYSLIYTYLEEFNEQ